MIYGVVSVPNWRAPQMGTKPVNLEGMSFFPARCLDGSLTLLAALITLTADLNQQKGQTNTDRKRIVKIHLPTALGNLFIWIVLASVFGCNCETVFRPFLGRLRWWGLPPFMNNTIKVHYFPASQGHNYRWISGVLLSSTLGCAFFISTVFPSEQCLKKNNCLVHAVWVFSTCACISRKATEHHCELVNLEVAACWGIKYETDVWFKNVIVLIYVTWLKKNNYVALSRLRSRLL